MSPLSNILVLKREITKYSCQNYSTTRFCSEPREYRYLTLNCVHSQSYLQFPLVYLNPQSGQTKLFVLIPVNYEAVHFSKDQQWPALSLDWRWGASTNSKSTSNVFIFRFCDTSNSDNSNYTFHQALCKWYRQRFGVQWGHQRIRFNLFYTVSC